MFDENSRYAKLTTFSMNVGEPDGVTREIRYVGRRFLPPIPSSQAAVEHAVQQGERLDNITAVYLGDPLLFWQICDGNFILSPEELTDEPGERIRIQLPGL